MGLEGADWVAECPKALAGRLDEREALSQSCDEKYEQKCEKKSHRDAESASPNLQIRHQFPLGLNSAAHKLKPEPFAMLSCFPSPTSFFDTLLRPTNLNTF